MWLKATFRLPLKYSGGDQGGACWERGQRRTGSVSVCRPHLVDVKLRLASGHLSVAGAELADEVVAVKEDTTSHLLPSAFIKHLHQNR